MSNPRTLNGDSIFKSGAYSSTSKLRQIKQNREYLYIILKVATEGFVLCIKKEEKKNKKKAKRKQSNSQPTLPLLFADTCVHTFLFHDHQQENRGESKLADEL